MKDIQLVNLTLQKIKARREGVAYIAIATDKRVISIEKR